MAIWATSTLALAGVTVASGAQAEPLPPSPCGFTLSPPQVVQVDGVSKVTATVTSTVCGVAASPYKSVACVSSSPVQQRGSCMQGTDTAQAYFEPYKPGATYTSSGRGLRHHRPDPARGQLPDPRADPSDPVGDH